MSRILHLTLKRKWFDMIASGEKPEEYRDIKPYWVDRLLMDKTPSWSLWEEPGCYEEFIEKAKCPQNDFLNSDSLFDYFHIKPKPYDIIRFKNGYNKSCPEMDIELLKTIVYTGKPEWGGGYTEYTFVLKLGKILSIKNYNP